MLIENNTQTLKIGDWVQVKSRGVTGKITGYSDGKWVVEVNGVPLREEATNLHRTQVLLG